jgi:hypothetical protein
MLVVGVIALASLYLMNVGSDFRDAPLELDRFDHGWRVNIEPDEEFSVDLFANPLHVDVPWQLADSNPAVVRLVDSEHMVAEDVPENLSPEESVEPGFFLPHSVFWFVAAAGGESPLTFELQVGGEVVDVTEFTLSVVQDACEGDVGIAANRCGLGDRDPEYGFLTIHEHGHRVTVQRGETFDLTLDANALHPQAPWQVVDVDTSILTLRSTTTDPARIPGDWDTSDRDKPWQFLPYWRFTFEAAAVGETPLVLEVVADGDRVEVYEVTVQVVEDG